MTESKFMRFNHYLVALSYRACSCQILSNWGREGTCEQCRDSSCHAMQRKSSKTRSFS